MTSFDLTARYSEESTATMAVMGSSNEVANLNIVVMKIWGLQAF